MKFIEDLEVKGKKVLVRVDFNVPIDKEGNITDDTRISKALPTINWLYDNGAKISLIAHFGRPKGKIVEKLKMNKIAVRLEEKIGKTVKKLDDCVGDEVKQAVESQQNEIILLENTRFHTEEKKDDPEFAKLMAAPFELYVDDAFGNIHRNDVSMYGVAKLLPGAIGFLVKNELDKLQYGLNPEKPLAVIIGGAKISTKIALIKNFLDKTDYILLGGAMIFTFYKAMGYEIGKSLYEEDMIEEVKSLLGEKKIILPIDIVIAKEISADSEAITVDFKEIPVDRIGLDIGEKSVELFKEKLQNCKTVIWNGPMGMFEFDKFSKGTFDLTKYLADLDGKVIVGGGDSVAVINKLGLEDKFYHVSTGGGASLAFLEGKKLPALDVLDD